MPLTASFRADVSTTFTKAIDLGTATLPQGLTKAVDFTDGTGVDQADRVFHDSRSISAADDIDLAGVLTDVFGATITFARLKALFVRHTSGTGNLIIGNAAANGFIGWFGAVTHTVTVRPNGFIALVAPDATAYAVTAGTGDILRFAPSTGTVGFDVVLVGAST